MARKFQMREYHLPNISIFSFQLSLVPHGVIQVPLRFTPSQIGLGKHKAKIVFRSEQVHLNNFSSAETSIEACLCF
jgi:hypothetical protein